MCKISTYKFNKMLNILDDKNHFDFDSFIEAVSSMKLGITQGTIDNIIDFLVFELGISCDADLVLLPQTILRKVVQGMNNILILDDYA